MTTARTKKTPQDQSLSQTAINDISAAILAGSIGSLAIGLFTIGAKASSGLKSALNWYDPAGAISGKTAAGVLVWLIVWFILRQRWQDKSISLSTIYTVSLVLIGLGLLFTFPPIFEAFG